MNTKTKQLTITKSNKTFTVKIDWHGFERLADSLGLFNHNFLGSLEKAEADVETGRVKRLRTLGDLRKSK